MSLLLSSFLHGGGVVYCIWFALDLNGAVIRTSYLVCLICATSCFSVPPANTFHAHVPFFSYYYQPQQSIKLFFTMKSSPQKCAFEEAIIILVVGLSRFFNGRWFSIEDLQALFVAGGIQNELTCDHIRLAIKSRNYGRLVENRFGKKSTRFFRCCKSIKSITPKETIGAEIPRIRRRHFLGSENEDQVSIIELYFKNTVLGKHGCGETASMPGQEQLTPTALSPIVVLPSMTITPGKEVTPSCHGSSPSKKQRKQIQTAITPVAKISFRPPSKVTPHKEEHTVSQSCRGWTGSHYESLFRQSLTECSYSAEIAARPSHVFGLSSVYADGRARELSWCNGPTHNNSDYQSEEESIS